MGNTKKKTLLVLLFKKRVLITVSVDKKTFENSRKKLPSKPKGIKKSIGNEGLGENGVKKIIKEKKYTTLPEFTAQKNKLWQLAVWTSEDYENSSKLMPPIGPIRTGGWVKITCQEERLRNSIYRQCSKGPMRD